MTWNWLIHIIPQEIVKKGGDVVQEYHRKYCTDIYLEPNTQYPKNGERRIIKDVETLKAEYEYRKDDYISWLDYAAKFADEEYAQLDNEGNVTTTQQDGWWIYSYHSKPLKSISEHNTYHFDMLVDREGKIHSMYEQYYQMNMMGISTENQIDKHKTNWEIFYEKTIKEASERGDSFIAVELPGM